MAVEIDGKTYRNLPEQVEENANNIESIKTTISELGTVMRYKGSVDTYDDLPTEDNQVGDFWNVIDTGDNYAWDGEGWDQIASSVDFSNLVDLDSAQTITGNKTFTANATFSANVFVSSGSRFYSGSSALWYYYPTKSYFATDIAPIDDNLRDIGDSTHKVKDIYLSGQVIGASNIFNVINANEMTDGTHFTNDQFALLINGKSTIVIGQIDGKDNIIFFPITLSSGSTWQYLGMYYFHTGSFWGIASYQLDNRTNALTLYSANFGAYGNNAKINNKTFPTYPTDTTKQYKLIQQVGGTLAWVEDN